MRIILLWIVFYSLCFSAQLEKVTLQLQWKHQFEFAGFYAAKELGFYEEAGLEVAFVEYDGKSSIVDSVLENKADMGLTYASIIAEYLQKKRLF